MQCSHLAGLLMRLLMRNQCSHLAGLLMRLLMRNQWHQNLQPQKLPPPKPMRRIIWQTVVRQMTQDSGSDVP